MGLVKNYVCDQCNTTLDSSGLLLKDDIVSTVVSQDGTRGTNRGRLIVKAGSYCKRCLVDKIEGRDSGPERGGPGDR